MPLSDYQVVVGLEVHSELATKSKIFCKCTTQFGGEPNTHCCPVCTGMPGTLPVLNKQAVEYAVMAGKALNCEISLFSKMDRKNYFYPDLPKAYQISQFDLPLCKNGYLDVEDENGEIQRIRINRIHLEEDAGKLIHDEYGMGSMIDYNRCGVPLIEIVTEPDIRSAEVGRRFFEKLKGILEFVGVSDCRMQEGSLRCDVNLSLNKKGADEFGTRSEMKNLNSFKAVYNAMVYESHRQADILDEGGTVIQETRRWDDNKNISISMRTKEDAHDYRYFPDPDLVPIVLEAEYVEGIKIPELPEVRREKYINEYKLPEYDADILVSSKDVSDFFEDCMSLGADAKTVSNWIMGDIMKLTREKQTEIKDAKITAKGFIELLALVDNKTISMSAAKQVFEIMFETGKDAETVVEEKGLKQMSDTGELENIIKKIIEDNPKSVEDYKAGKKKAIGFFVGQTMRMTKGKGNPQVINKILLELLGDN